MDDKCKKVEYMELLHKLSENIFHDYENDVIFTKDPAERHRMTREHEEILGQFLDFTAYSPEELKRILLNGYLKGDENRCTKLSFKHCMNCKNNKVAVKEYEEKHNKKNYYEKIE